MQTQWVRQAPTAGAPILFQEAIKNQESISGGYKKQQSNSFTAQGTAPACTSTDGSAAVLMSDANQQLSSRSPGTEVQHAGFPMGTEWSQHCERPPSTTACITEILPSRLGLQSIPNAVQERSRQVGSSTDSPTQTQHHQVSCAITCSPSQHLSILAVNLHPSLSHGFPPSDCPRSTAECHETRCYPPAFEELLLFLNLHM